MRRQALPDAIFADLATIDAATVAELEPRPTQINTKTDIQSIIRTAESVLRGSEPPADEENTFREWLAEEHLADVPDVEPGMLETVIRATLAGLRMAASPQALAFYRKQLVGLLARWQQVAPAAGGAAEAGPWEAGSAAMWAPTLGTAQVSGRLSASALPSVSEWGWVTA